MLRAEPAVFGPVASNPTASHLIDTLAASGEKALRAIRSARSEIRSVVWSLAGENAPETKGQVTVDLDGVLVSRTPTRRTRPRTGRRPTAIPR